MSRENDNHPLNEDTRISLGEGLSIEGRSQSIESEIPRIDREQALEYLLLLRGEPHNPLGIRKKQFTDEEIKRAKALISEIGEYTQGINTDSLTKMMFDSPVGKPVPAKDPVKFGSFDFAMVARNWKKPPKGYVDQMASYRQLMEETYLVGDVERRFLLAGDERLEELNPSPVYIFSVSAA